MTNEDFLYHQSRMYKWAYLIVFRRIINALFGFIYFSLLCYQQVKAALIFYDEYLFLVRETIYSY